MKITIDVLSAIEDNQLRMLCQCTSGFMELTKAVLKLDGVTFSSVEEFLAQPPLQELKSAYNSVQSTDDWTLFVKKYKENHPELIKYIDQENDAFINYQKGDELALNGMSRSFDDIDLLRKNIVMKLGTETVLRELMNFNRETLPEENDERQQRGILLSPYTLEIPPDNSQDCKMN